MTRFKMHVEHVQARRSSPVAKQSRLDVLALQRLAQQRVIEQIDLPDGKIVGSAPKGIHLPQFVRREWAFHVGFGF